MARGGGGSSRSWFAGTRHLRLTQDERGVFGATGERQTCSGGLGVAARPSFFVVCLGTSLRSSAMGLRFARRWDFASLVDGASLLVRDGTSLLSGLQGDPVRA